MTGFAGAVMLSGLDRASVHAARIVRGVTCRRGNRRRIWSLRTIAFGGREEGAIGFEADFLKEGREAGAGRLASRGVEWVFGAKRGLAKLASNRSFSWPRRGAGSGGGIGKVRRWR